MTDAAGRIVGIGTSDPAETTGRRERLLDWVATVDHKRIGILYLLTTLGFFCLGGIEALIMRIQLARPESALLTPDAYNQLFTMHGTTMVFLVVMPLLTGFANYLVPLMIGARDVAFPRLNAFSYWLLLFGGLLLYFSFLAGGAPNAGWFSYAPLSERPYSSGPGLDYWALALLVLGAGSIASAINLIVTILTMRADGLTIRRLPLFVWMTLVNSFLILAALPALNASLVMLLVDRLLGGHFFIAQSTAAVAAGRGAILWQHFFWSFGHPEVYIMVLPAFGIISEVIPVFSRKPIFGYEFVAGSTVAIALLSYGVWAHHMFAVGLGHPFDAAFSGASLLIAVPTGVKIFNWIATMWGGSIRLTTAMLFAIGFLVMFTLGGITGVLVAMVPIDWQVTDSYFIVAHMHYVLFGGTAFAVLAGVYYWFPKMTGRLLDERWGAAHFWLTVIGFNLTFFDQHLLGMMGMPRRVFTYPALPYWGVLNLLSTIGACVLAVSVLVLVWNVWTSLRRGELAGSNPWAAWTLEWATTSPPPEHNFDAVPPVRGRRPLWDLAHPDRPDPDGGGGGGDPLGTTPAFVAHPPVTSAALGMLLFLGSEAVFFVFLVIGYVYLHSAGVQQASAVLDPRVTGGYTIALLASSATIWRAGRDKRPSRGWLLATIALGVLFLVGQSREYWRLLHNDVTVSRDLFGTLFYTLTGIHGVHVAAGVVMMLVLVGVLWRSTRVALDRVALESVALYWHLVDAVWIVIFSVVYLGGRFIA
jgi:cytochrome c oxidase subunit I